MFKMEKIKRNGFVAGLIALLVGTSISASGAGRVEHPLSGIRETSRESFVVYVKKELGIGNICRKDFDEGSEEINLTRTLADDRNPDVSPNGKEIVFDSKIGEDKRGIYIMDSKDGRKLRGVTEDGRNPVWNYNGKGIVFEREIEGNVQLFAINLEDKLIRQITKGNGNNYNPDCSHDGRIVFVSDRDDEKGDIWAVNSDGRGLEKLTDEIGYEGYPCFSPFGDFVVYSSDKKDNNADLWMIKQAGGKWGEPIRLTKFPGYELHAAINSSGEEMIYAAGGPANFSIYRRPVELEDADDSKEPVKKWKLGKLLLSGEEDKDVSYLEPCFSPYFTSLSED